MPLDSHTMPQPGFTRFVEYAPGTSVANDELPMSFQNIERRTGIERRNIAGPDETVETMALEAGRRIFAALDLKGEDCNGLVLASCLGDSKTLHGIARSVAKSLGIKGDHIRVSGLNYACSGFPAATEKALEYCTDPERHIVVITSEILSRLVDWQREDTAILLADRAAATTVCADGAHEILEAKAGYTDDSQELLVLKKIEDALDAYGHTEMRECIVMHGKELYRRAPAEMFELVQASLERLGLRLSDVSAIVQHQANGKFAQKLRKILAEKDGGTDVRVVDGISRMGNVGSSSIPCALMQIQDGFEDGGIVACPAVGAGPDWQRGRMSQGIVTFRTSGS